jgi:2-polyprenyl-3-methyl-5-hydroxy-6-metoxy-1,4-benzoquinol methylase
MKQFEWYQNYEQLKDVITQFITKDNQILNIGCGNSSKYLINMIEMSECMFKSGYFKITNVDWSPTVIEQMKEKYKDYGTHFKCTLYK